MPEELNKEGWSIAKKTFQKSYDSYDYEDFTGCIENSLQEAIEAYLPYHDKQRDERVAELERRIADLGLTITKLRIEQGIDVYKNLADR